MDNYTNTYPDYNNNLSELLEAKPRQFLEEIKTQTPKTREWATYKCKSYYNWYSPPLHQLVRITGKLVKPKYLQVGSIVS